MLKRSSFCTDSAYAGILAQYNLTEKRRDEYQNEIRFLTVSKNAALTVLETANRLYEKDMIDFCHPLFLCRNYQPHYLPSDPLFPYQYNYVNNNTYLDEWLDPVAGKDIGVEKAWEITKGSPAIEIAVLDEGLTVHPDFSTYSIIDTIDLIGSNRNYPLEDHNCTPYEKSGHGYATTGLIIAAHNGIGIAGIAPQCRVIFIKVADDNGLWNQNEEIYAKAFKLVADYGVKIISNSWGCGSCTPTDIMTEALNYCTDPNIAGHNCAIFFSAGNDALSRVAYPGLMPQVLSVGSTDSIDQKWAYSSFGVDLDVMATSGNIPHYIHYPDQALAG